VKCINKCWLLLMILFVLLIISSCDNDNKGTDTDFEYPISVGSSWDYDIVSWWDFDSLATSNGFEDITFYETESVEVISQEIVFDTLQAYKFKTTTIQETNISTKNHFYDNIDNNFICYGYRKHQFPTSKIEQSYAFLKFRDRKFNTLNEIIEWVELGFLHNEHSRDDSLIYDPVVDLDYPLEEGKQWIYRTNTNEGEPWRIDKKIIDQVEIEVPAGKFNCWEVQWLSNPLEAGPDLDEDFVSFDYIAKEGLIKRVVELKNIECYESSDHILGYLNHKTESVLKGYE